MKNLLWTIALIFCLAACSISCGRKADFVPDKADFPVLGIDVSAHNGVIDFSQVAADSVTFVYIKATEGDDFCDAMFGRNVDSALEAGLRVGAYHFFRFKTPGHIQAYHFLNTASAKELDLPLAIDVEDWNNDDGVPPEEVIEQLHSMVQVLTSHGYKVLIYTNMHGYKRYIEDRIPGVSLWIASLKEEPDVEGWSIWQYSHTGHVDGVQGNVDRDTFNGTLADFNAWAQL